MIKHTLHVKGLSKVSLLDSDNHLMLHDSWCFYIWLL